LHISKAEGFSQAVNSNYSLNTVVSSSTQTISAPEANALGNISGRKPGENIKLRLGCMVASFFMELFDFQGSILAVLIILFCLLSSRE